MVLSNLVLSQSQLLDSIVDKHKDYDYSYSESFFQRIDTTAFNRHEQAIYCYEKGRYVLYVQKDRLQSYELQLAAKSLISRDSVNALFNINDELIYSQFSTAEGAAFPPERLIEENKNILVRTKEPIQQILCYYYDLSDQLQTSEGRKIAIKNLHKSIDLAQELEDKTLECSIKGNLAFAFQNEGVIDSAIHYYQEIIPYFQQENRKDKLYPVYINLGELNAIYKQHQKSINYYNKALELSQENQTKDNVALIRKSVAKSYLELKNYEKSALFYDQYVAMNDSLTELANSEKLSELQAKYDVTQKEKEIAEEKAANERMQKIGVALILATALIILAAILIYNNQKKRRLIAEQAKEIEKERADAILKNQQLATIDAMISGQEKERKRVAEELHDDIGSSLTTIRLYYDQLKGKITSDDLDIYSKTEHLLEDAYEKIRNMSHVKHSGVLASKGLIPALKQLTNNISKSGTISIDVIHHGLDKTFNNTYELQVFRIIQELLNNVVKHSDATYACVSLTAYDDIINLMIEDNGKGFDYNKVKSNEGIGLNSIEERIVEVNGTFEVDSAIGRGTIINIDLPL